MAKLLHVLICLLTVALAGAPAMGQFHDAEPAAADAFEKLIASYRARPALTVESTVSVTISADDMDATSEEVTATFVLTNDKRAKVTTRGLECYLSNGTITIVHRDNEQMYFISDDGGSPYYALLMAFMDLPFPHMSIFLGESDMEDLYMQFHPRSPWVRPTGVAEVNRDGRDVQVITMSSDFEGIEIVVNPETMLIESMTVEVTGGHLVREGMTMLLEHGFTYTTHDAPLPDETFTFDPGERQRVDTLAALFPRRGPEQRQAGGATVGREAPPFVLATSDGDAIDLEDLRGQVVVIDFWATWCGPCIVALPLLHDVDRWARDELLPVKVMTINTFEILNPDDNSPDARLEQARSFWQEHRFRLPVAMDYTDEVAAEYGVSGIPTTFVIRSDGVVHSKHVGAGTSYVDDLKRDIREAIAAVE
jgi:thiol-disulfide isomerase/thioredoxin